MVKYFTNEMIYILIKGLVTNCPLDFITSYNPINYTDHESKYAFSPQFTITDIYNMTTISDNNILIQGQLYRGGDAVTNVKSCVNIALDATSQMPTILINMADSTCPVTSQTTTCKLSKTDLSIMQQIVKISP